MGRAVEFGFASAVLAGRPAIQRHIGPSLTLRLKYRIARVFSGLLSGIFLIVLTVGCYMCFQLDDLPKQLLWMLAMTWHAYTLHVVVAAFGSLTCPKQTIRIPGDSYIAKIAVAAFVCHLLGGLGFTIQGGQPTMLVALSMTALAAMVAAVLVRHKLDADKPLVFQLAS